MNLRRLAIILLLPLLPVLAAEAFSYYWMNPPRPDGPVAIPHFSPPVVDRTFEPNQKDFDAAKVQLMCSGGWSGKRGGDAQPLTRLSWVEWDRTSVANTLEAFRHVPEECMGSVGMTQEKVYPPREAGSGERRMVFDSALFRAQRGGAGMYVFKTVWASGTGSFSLRGDFFGFDLGTINRSRLMMRLATTLHRFKPEHTRVLMAGVTGLPSEELAWEHFSREILPQVQWTTVQPSAEN